MFFKGRQLPVTDSRCAGTLDPGRGRQRIWALSERTKATTETSDQWRNESAERVER
jgi:hypothetical protein